MRKLTWGLSRANSNESREGHGGTVGVITYVKDLWKSVAQLYDGWTIEVPIVEDSVEVCLEKKHDTETIGMPD